MSGLAPWLSQAPRTNIVVGPSKPVAPVDPGTAFAPYLAKPPPKFNISGKPAKKWPTVETKKPGNKSGSTSGATSNASVSARKRRSRKSRKRGSRRTRR